MHKQTIRANEKVCLGKKGGRFPHGVLSCKADNVFEYWFLVITELDNGEIRVEGIDKLNPMIKWPIFYSFFTSRANGNDRLCGSSHKLLRPLSFLFGKIKSSPILMVINTYSAEVVSYDVFPFLFAGNQLPITGIEEIKGFGLIDCVNVGVEAD